MSSWLYGTVNFGFALRIGTVSMLSDPPSCACLRHNWYKLLISLSTFFNPKWRWINLVRVLLSATIKPEIHNNGAFWNLISCWDCPYIIHRAVPSQKIPWGQDFCGGAKKSHTTTDAINLNSKSKNWIKKSTLNRNEQPTWGKGQLSQFN